MVEFRIHYYTWYKGYLEGVRNEDDLYLLERGRAPSEFLLLPSIRHFAIAGREWFYGNPFDLEPASRAYCNGIWKFLLLPPDEANLANYLIGLGWKMSKLDIDLYPRWKSERRISSQELIDVPKARYQERLREREKGG